MKILLLNSSPRKNGNTTYATQKISKNIVEHTSHSVESIKITDLKVGGCIACDGCSTNDEGCIFKDDTQYIMDKISDANLVVFLVPVYWWGIPSQLKAVVDKFYSVQSKLKTQNKKIGLITIGANEINDRQYSLISEQFDCINNFLGWEKIFDLSFSAYKVDDLEKSKDGNIKLSNIYEYLV